VLKTPAKRKRKTATASSDSTKRAAASRDPRRERTARAGRPGGGVAHRPAATADQPVTLFPSLSDPSKRFGVAVLLAVAERWGAEGAVQCIRQEALFERPGSRPKTSLLERANVDALARVLSGFAHPDRIRIARSILAGANTHHLLIEAVRIKTGPLYHHLRELERAGLVSMMARNAYAVTDFGRLAMFVTAALGVQAAAHGGSRTGKTSLISQQPARPAVRASKGDSATRTAPRK
jgi:hypothetical protein